MRLQVSKIILPDEARGIGIKIRSAQALANFENSPLNSAHTVWHYRVYCSGNYVTSVSVTDMHSSSCITHKVLRFRTLFFFPSINGRCMQMMSHQQHYNLELKGVFGISLKGIFSLNMLKDISLS